MKRKDESKYEMFNVFEKTYLAGRLFLPDRKLYLGADYAVGESDRA